MVPDISVQEVHSHNILIIFHKTIYLPLLFKAHGHWLLCKDVLPGEKSLLDMHISRIRALTEKHCINAFVIKDDVSIVDKCGIRRNVLAPLTQVVVYITKIHNIITRVIHNLLKIFAPHSYETNDS